MPAPILECFHMGSGVCPLNLSSEHSLEMGSCLSAELQDFPVIQWGPSTVG